jgi:AraC family transcriptional regulator, transcriptional activator FtrA
MRKKAANGGADRRHLVAAVVADGFSPFEFSVACEVFGLDRSSTVGVPWYRFAVCAAEPTPVKTSIGFTVSADHPLDVLRRADTIIVPTFGEGTDGGEQLHTELCRAHRRGARLISFCTGAFVLAGAGLLDGRRATTHWGWTDELVRRHPRVHVDPDVLYVDDGDILTSAGTAASIDLALYVVRQDYGAEIANAVARRMVVAPHRDGGQAQFIASPVPDAAASDLFPDTLAWMQTHLDRPLTVPELARRSAMSPRTFARRFLATTGVTPHQWLLRQRVLRAQELLETTDLSVDLVASRCGMGSASNLRQHFHRIVRTTPQAYRNTFSSASG